MIGRRQIELRQGLSESSLHEKLLDDTEVILYCDRQFDRQAASSLS